MGSVSRDIDKKSREYDDSYPYEAAGIAALLRDIHSLSESREYKGDIDATILIVDLKQALDSECLTPRMRQVVSLYYFSQMIEEEVADVLGIGRRAVNYALESAIERISTYMEYGYSKPNNARIEAFVTPSHPFLMWVNDVAAGSESVYSYSADQTNWLALRGDRKAQEAVRQQKEGYTYVPVYASEEIEYPALTWDQMSWDDRRVVYVGEMKFDDSRSKGGFKKVAILNEEDEWCYNNRQRVFNKNN
jgi:hypothetical protein